MENKNIICFDLEGPISLQDNAFEVMGLIKNGKRIFEVISRYDDILTLEGRENYEPGDTLKLIVPFLIYHDISEEDIRGISDNASLTPGVEYTIHKLRDEGWRLYIISTSYEQHAYNIAERVGIPRERTFCTSLPLDELKTEMKERDAELIENVENDILERLYLEMNDEMIKERLDRFYYREINKTDFGNIINKISVVGGSRKVDAVIKISNMNDKKISDMIAVGDSITDYKMLDFVRHNDGISIVFNGNDYAVPYANFGLASPDMRFLLIITSAYTNGGKSNVKRVVKRWESDREKFEENPEGIPKEFIPEHVRKFLIERKSEPGFMMPYLHNLEDADDEKIKSVVEIHRKFREFMRGEAAKLG
ncbi:MAG: hypothetical protein DRO90_01375 [Candidatus Altiarchaeales archaeon]|nr:MAG: hypothetical protein DRO95_01260 [Candidatus Altiarchaeales archaeon]RLI94846.1 MAG: hypothetical protein DRO90_01375 [Candidatus Altiarchaeales archaeon]RLI95133.1 MAG: hypothetical protein DRO94_01265 [Candidatus Altiarchaeales archaeon]HDO82866.1 hypothetical protein [Candidatus Altiarchaeales archaeon]HEX55515.1 hypothetical protein [Candidatus Altiarchaeales archaeon]